MSREGGAFPQCRRRSRRDEEGGCVREGGAFPQCRRQSRGAVQAAEPREITSRVDAMASI